jgi:hypothetical protein
VVARVITRELDGTVDAGEDAEDGDHRLSIAVGVRSLLGESRRCEDGPRATMARSAFIEFSMTVLLSCGADGAKASEPQWGRLLHLRQRLELAQHLGGNFAVDLD